MAAVIPPSDLPLSVEGKAVLVPEEAELAASDTEFVVVVQPGEVDCLRLVLVNAWPGAADPTLYRRWTDIITSSALPVVVMGDFNNDALQDPQLSRVIKEWWYQVQPPRWAWTRRGGGAHAGQHSMIDFVLVLDGMPVRECRLVGRMPVRTDHRLVVVEVSLGEGSPGAVGVLPRPAQIAHRQVPEHQWERFARDHETRSSTWEPHLDPPL